MTTRSQWFPDSQVNLHPPLLLLVHAPGGLHAGCVAPKQTGTEKARQVDSGLGNYLLFISHHLVGQLDMNGFHRRFTYVSVHHMRFDI